MKTHDAMTLKDVANAGDLARLVLGRAGLDFCCLGQMSLREACRRQGVDPRAIEAQLANLQVPPTTHWGTNALLDHVLDVAHPRTRRLLSELRTVALDVPDEDELGAILRPAIDALVAHASQQMGDEERVLFVRVRALAAARKGRGPFPPALRTMHEHVERLREGHARTHDHLRRLRPLVASLSGTCAERLRARFDDAERALIEQMHLENNELIPRALDLEPDEPLLRD